MQSKSDTAHEAAWNTGIGLLGSFAITYVTIWFCEGNDAFTVSFWIVYWCTVWSVLRNYYMRRYWIKRSIRRRFESIRNLSGS